MLDRSIDWEPNHHLHPSELLSIDLERLRLRAGPVARTCSPPGLGDEGPGQQMDWPYLHWLDASVGQH